MSYKSTFLDNTAYGATDINNVIGKIVTGGVAEVFHDGQSYNTSDLNKINAFIAAWGVTPQNNTTLKVIKDGTNVKIQAGTAFFASGTSITITDFETLPFTAGVKNYVYVKSDISLNTIKPYCTTVTGAGDFVPLAEIEIDGTVTDKRVYCKGKLAGYQSGQAIYDTITLNKTYSIGGWSMPFDTWVKVDSIIVSKSNYKYVGIYNANSDASTDRFVLQNLDTTLFEHALYYTDKFVYSKYYSKLSCIKFVKTAFGIDVYLMGIGGDATNFSGNINMQLYFS